MAEQNTSPRTTYEQRQHFNPLTTWLHSFRYRHIHRVFAHLSVEIGDRPIRVIDIGCGYAKLFTVLNDRFRIEYTGIERNEERVGVARERHGHHENFRVVHDSATEALAHVPPNHADIVVALETFEHIPEHDVVRIVERIAELRPRRLVCSVPVEIGPAIWLKNVGSFLTGYVRHRDYSWRETFWAGLYCLDKLPPHGTRHKGFDWRWLAQTVRHNFGIRAIHRLPLRVLPSALSTNVFFVAEPRAVPDRHDARPDGDNQMIASTPAESIGSRASSREGADRRQETLA